MSLFHRIRTGLRRHLRRQTVPRFREQAASPLYVLRLEERRVLNGAPLAEFQQPEAVHDDAPSLAPSDDAAESPASPATLQPGRPTRTFDAGEYADDGRPDVFLLRRGAEVGAIEVTINATSVYSGPADGAALTFHGSGDDDTLVIDFSAGNPLEGATISFDVGAGGEDQLLYLGGSAVRTIHHFASAGAVHQLDYRGWVDGGEVRILGMDAGAGHGADRVVDQLAATHREFQFSLPGRTVTFGSETIASTNSPSNEAHEELVASFGDAAFLQTAPPAQSLTIEGDQTNIELVGPHELRVPTLALSADSIHLNQVVVGQSVTMHAVDTLEIGEQGGVRVTNGPASLVFLDAGDGRLEVAGVVEAVSLATGDRGGTIHLLGEDVRLTATARIDASGGGGGGTILVGGDFQGRNPEVRNARQTIIETGAVLQANALDHGAGGRIILWADEFTYFAGAIAARGGARGGDGGFAEVSGKETLAYRGFADLNAPRGARGNLLLDPRNITIAAVSLTPIGPNNAFNENPGDDVTISAAAVGLATIGANLTLQANRDILVTTSVTGGGGDLTLEAGRQISLSAGVTINTLGGDLTLLANSPAANAAHRGAGPGQLLMANGAAISSTGTVTLQVGDGGESGDLVLADVSGEVVVIENLGATNGSGIQRVSDDALITAASSLSFYVAASGAEIGTLAAPIRVQGGTVSALGQSGGVFLSSPTQGLYIGNISTWAGGSIHAAAAGDIVVIELISADGAGAISLNAGEAAIITGAPIASGSGDITLTSDNLHLEGYIQSAGALVLQPFSPGQLIGINDFPSEVGYFLDCWEIELLDDGFSSITIGRSDGAHSIAIGAASFRDPLVIRAPASGGSITVNGQLDTLALAGEADDGPDASSITFVGPGATTVLADNVVTAGGAVLFSDAVRVADGRTVLIDTTNSGEVAAGAAITFEHTVNGDADTAAVETLQLNAGAAGVVTFQREVGDTQTLDLTIINSGSATFADVVNARQVNLIETATTISFQDDVNLLGMTTNHGSYALAFGGSNNAITNHVNFNHRGTLVLGGAASHQFLFAGGATINGAANGPASTTLAGLVQTANDSTLSLLGPAELAADTTIRTDQFSLGGDLDGGGFQLVLETDEASDAVAIGSGATGGTDLLAIDATTISHLSPTTFSAIVIGRTDGAGALTVVGAAAFADPLTLRTSAAGALRVSGPLATTAGADAASLTLESDGGVITLASSLTTRGGVITLGGPVRVADGMTASIDATAGGLAPSGAGLRFDHAVNGDSATAAVETLRLNAGASGDILFQAPVGAAEPLSVTIDQSRTTVFAESLHAVAVSINATITSVAFTGNTVIDAGLTTSPGAYAVALTGASNSVAAAATFQNTGVLTLGDDSTDQFTFGGGLTATAPAIINAAGAIATTNDSLNLGNVVTSAGETLRLNTGLGTILLGSFTGGDLEIVSSGGTTFGGAVTAAVVTLTDTTGSIVFQGDTALATLNTAAQDYSLAFTGGSNAVANAVTFQNTGALTLGADSSHQFTFGGGVTAVAPATVIARGTIATTNDPITLGDVATGAGHTLRLNAGSGAIALGSFTGGDLEIVASGGATFSGQVLAGEVTLTGAAGAIVFEGSVTLTTLLTTSQGYSVAFQGPSNVFTNGVTFQNTGAVTLGNDSTDQFLFDGGVTATAPANVNAAGTFITSDDSITLGAVITASGRTLRLDAGAGAIGLAAFTGGDLEIVASGGTVFSGTVLADSVTLTDTTGSVEFRGNTTLASLITTAQDYHVALTGANNSIANAVLFQHTGDLTLGDNSADQITFGGGVTAVAPATITAAGTIATTNDAITFDAVNTVAGRILRLDAGAAAISIASFTGGDLEIVASGGTAFHGPVQAGAVTITSSTGVIAFEGNVTLNALNTSAQGYGLVFNGSVNSIASGVTFRNTGELTLGADGLHQFTFGGGVTATAPTVIHAIGTIQTTDDPLTFGAVETPAGALLRLGAGSGVITLGSFVGGDLEIVGSGGASIAGPFTAETVTLSDTSGTIAFQGDTTILTGLVTLDRPYSVSLTGANNHLPGATVFLNTGTVTLGDQASDVFMLPGGLTTAGSPSNPTLTRVGGQILTEGAVIVIGRSQLLAAAVLDTTNGDAFPNGAAIRFTDTLDGGSNLTLIAGNDAIRFDASVGQAERLGAVTIASAGDVSAAGAFSAAALTQSQGMAGATTSFLGPLSTNAAAGIDLTAYQIVFSGPIHTTAGGGVRLNNAELLTLEAGADMQLAGSFAQVGAGAVQTGADIASASGSVGFASVVQLLGDVAISTGAATGGDITFNGAIAGGGFDLQLSAGGHIIFDGPVQSLGSISAVAGGDIRQNAPLAAVGEVIYTTRGALVNANGGAVQVTARTLTVAAEQGLFLETMVEQAALVSATGDIRLNEMDAVILQRLSADYGAVVVRAGGAVRADDISGQSVDIGLATGDLTVATIAANGSVQLLAESGAILDDGDDATRITGNLLALRASSGVGAIDALEATAAVLDVSSDTGGVSLAILAETAVTLQNANALAGDIRVHQSGGRSLTVVSATAATGNIILENLGEDLQVDFVAAGPTGAAIISTVERGDVRIGLVMAGAQVAVTAAGAITESVADSDVDVQTSAAALRSREGIGDSDPLEVAAAVLAVENLGPGDVRIDHLGGAPLTIGAVGEIEGVALVDAEPRGGAFLLTSRSGLMINAPIVNAAGGDIQLTTVAGGDLIVNARVVATGGDGYIRINSGRDLVLRDTGAEADISVSGEGWFIADFEGELISTGDVLVTSGVGAAAPGRPQLANIEASQVTALGDATVRGNFGLPGERNFLFTVDWADGSGNTLQFEEPGEFVLTHRYSGNPNQENPAAPIPIELTLARNSNISFVGLDTTTFVVGSANVAADGDSLLIFVSAPVPGEGLFAAIGQLNFGGAIVTFEPVVRTEAFTSRTETPAAPTTVLNVGASSSETASDRESYLEINVLLPIDDQGGVLEVEVKQLPIKVLADLPSLFSLLPNDRYRIYLVRRDGGKLEVIEGFVRDGKFYDPSGVKRVPRPELPSSPEQPVDPPQAPPSTKSSAPTNGASYGERDMDSPFAVPGPENGYARVDETGSALEEGDSLELQSLDAERFDAPPGAAMTIVGVAASSRVAVVRRRLAHQRRAASASCASVQKAASIIRRLRKGP